MLPRWTPRRCRRWVAAGHWCRPTAVARYCEQNAAAAARREFSKATHARRSPGPAAVQGQWLAVAAHKPVSSARRIVCSPGAFVLCTSRTPRMGTRRARTMYARASVHGILRSRVARRTRPENEKRKNAIKGRRSVAPHKSNTPSGSGVVVSQHVLKT